MTRETSVTPPRRGKESAEAGAGHFLGAQSATGKLPRASAPHTFPREARILSRADFRLTYDNGIRMPGPMFAAFCLAHTEGSRISGRLGITVPRALGKAVDRNRIKRRIREAFRLHRGELDPKWDIVLNPRRPALAAEFPALERAILKLIERCNAS